MSRPIPRPLAEQARPAVSRLGEAPRWTANRLSSSTPSGLTSLDPALDLLIVRFHLETGACRSGGVGLRWCDLDERRSTVWLTEKGSLPAQPHPRQASSTQLVGHHKPGRHIPAPAKAHVLPSARRPAASLLGDYDRLFAVLRRCSAPGRYGFRSRRTSSATPPSPRMAASAAIRSRRHSPATRHRRSPAGTSTTKMTEIASAVAVMTGEAHPLAPTPTARACARH